MIEIKHLALSEQASGFCLFTTDKELMLRIEATALGVFRVRMGTANKLDDSKLNPRAKARQELLLARHELSSEFEVQEVGAQQWRLSHGNTALEITANPLRLTFYQDEQCILATDTRQAIQFSDDDYAPRWEVALGLTDAEAVYGLGRTSNTFNRRGQQIVSDDYQQHYLPFAWSPRGWGIFPNSLHRVVHRVGLAKSAHRYSIEISEATLDCFFFIGSTAEIFNQFSATIGRVGQPSLRAMGIWLDQASQQSLTDFVAQAEQLEKAGFPIDTLHLAPPSAFVFQKDKLNFEWDEVRLGDARQFTADYIKGQKHLCVPTLPTIPVGTPLFADLEDRAWLLLKEDGKAYTIKTEQGKFGLLDLTYKDAYKFWETRHQQLLEASDTSLSIAHDIKITDGVSARQGESDAFLRHLYPSWLEQSLFDAQAFHKTPSEGYVRRHHLSLNSPRSTGVHVDYKVKTFEDLNTLLRLHLSTQASGVIAQTHQLDLSKADKTLYLRFLALSVFSAGFSLAADSLSLPTAFDKKTQEIIRVFLDLRYRLVPYVVGIIEDATRTGLPVQRMMSMVYPNDSFAHQYEQQYLFGPALLVAPILDDSTQKEIYLPEGDAWWDLNTGIRYEGGQILQYECGLHSIPVFGREGHMLCLGPVLKGLTDFNSARILDEVWLFGMPVHNPVVMRNKIRVMQMQGSSYIKGFEGLRILQSEGLEVKRRGAEVRISRER